MRPVSGDRSRNWREIAPAGEARNAGIIVSCYDVISESYRSIEYGESSICHHLPLMLAGSGRISAIAARKAGPAWRKPVVY